MGRTLKDGTWKPKPSASKEYERLSQPPHPLPILRKGTEVKVFCGAGWQKGKVVSSTRDFCTVYLSQGRRNTTCRDARNIILA
jgi:hypothetical protein